MFNLCVKHRERIQPCSHFTEINPDLEKHSCVRGGRASDQGRAVGVLVLPLVLNGCVAWAVTVSLSPICMTQNEPAG